MNRGRSTRKGSISSRKSSCAWSVEPSVLFLVSSWCLGERRLVGQACFCFYHCSIFYRGLTLYSVLPAIAYLQSVLNHPLVALFSATVSLQTTYNRPAPSSRTLSLQNQPKISPKSAKSVEKHPSSLLSLSLCISAWPTRDLLFFSLPLFFFFLFLFFLSLFHPSILSSSYHPFFILHPFLPSFPLSSLLPPFSSSFLFLFLLLLPSSSSSSSLLSSFLLLLSSLLSLLTLLVSFLPYHQLPCPSIRYTSLSIPSFASRLSPASPPLPLQVSRRQLSFSIFLVG